MKIGKKSILLFLSIISCCMLKQTLVMAEEYSECVQPQDKQELSVLEETDTSIVYDMGMVPAIELSVSTLVFENPTNSYSTLKTPAQIVRQGENYFIVDCYHNQILYSRTLETPVKNWKVMTNDVSLPHSIDSDGEAYLVTDTENNRVLVFERRSGRFQNTQCLNDIGVRPHYIEYDEQTQSFFVWSSMTGEMYVMKREPHTGTVCIQEIRKVKELADFYVRSFTIAGDQILFPSGNNGYMLMVDKKTFEVQARFPVTEEIAGMAFVQPIGSYFYMTISSDLSYDQSKATMIRTKDLNSLQNGKYENIYDEFPTDGIPYYIDYINGLYYMTNHSSEKSIWRFAVENNEIGYVGSLY